MKRVLEFLKCHKYFVGLFVFIGFSIVLSTSYSNYFVESKNHRVAEMYIGSLKYSMKIDSNETNTLTVEPGETIIDVDVKNLNPVDTYYKLLYLNNSNLEIKYFSETKDTDEVKTSYKSPNDSVTSSNTNNLKIFIRNNSTTSQNVSFSLKGGYINNTLSDISVPSGYSEITVIETPSSNTYFCKTNDTLTQGLEYVNEQYTYRYMQEFNYDENYDLNWVKISNNGWGVQLTDKTNTEAVTSKLCTYVNNNPVVSMSHMFSESQATTLDLSNFDTSNVTNMRDMFQSSQATTLDISNFDTSKVTNMMSMFNSSQATTLDVSNFDTSNVTNMSNMFQSSKTATLDLSNFNTNKVTDMSYMFYNNQATALDLSSFDTSNVIYMSYMFCKSQATTLDISNFDTSKVRRMDDMFGHSQVTTLDVSSFNTSNVRNMYGMFSDCQATTLDLSSFDTSNVGDMRYMFYNSGNLKTIYASNKFNAVAVTNGNTMFSGCTSLVGGSGTTYNSNYVDKTYARIDGGTSNPGYFTDVSQKPSTFDTDDWATIVKSIKAGNIKHYKVGDTKTIDMGSYGTHTLRVANTSTPSECSTSGFSQTACGFVLEFADIITTHNMNSSSTNAGGWPATSMRTFVNNDIYNSLPTDLKTGIINTTVVSSHGKAESNFTSTDKLYLLAPKEIYDDWNNNYDTAKDLTRQLDYYKNEGVSGNKNSSKAMKKYNSTGVAWWLRFAYSDNNWSFFNINSLGNFSGLIYPDEAHGVSPAFRIG